MHTDIQTEKERQTETEGRGREGGRAEQTDWRGLLIFFISKICNTGKVAPTCKTEEDPIFIHTVKMHQCR